MKPVVVLVGRPNVGKSTLFNALTRTRDAIVSDFAGLTRDRQYGEGRVGGRPYLVVDTGGLVEAADPLQNLSEKQTDAALVEADAVVFVVDARSGRLPADLEIAARLRRLGRRIVLAVNKSEGLPAGQATVDFHGLGLGEPIPISAAHGLDLHRLIQSALAEIPRDPLENEAGEGSESSVPRIAVLGRPNAGKSTLINIWLGEDRVVVSDVPGTTRDSIYIHCNWKGRAIELIDTAGVRRRARVDGAVEKFSVVKTLKAVDEANVVVLLIDATVGIGDHDLHLAGHVLEQGRAVAVALNKWDAVDMEGRERLEKEVDRRLPFLDFASLHTISARTGSGVRPLMAAALKAYEAARCNTPTALLNKLLAKAVQSTPPPRRHGRLMRPKYLHQGGINPPRFVLHGNQVESLPDAWRRYLSGFLRRELGLEGTPIVIECQDSTNPYLDKPEERLAPRAAWDAKRARRKVRAKKAVTARKARTT